MNNITIIQDEIEDEFLKYLSELLKFNKTGDQLKYFYWNEDFFAKNGNLKFRYFPLNQEEKERINKIGETIFEDSKITFKVNIYSHRSDITINNITKLFDDQPTNQKKKYEYIKEFILWKIMKTISDHIADSTWMPKANQQRLNFLHSYFNYIKSENILPGKDVLDKYIKFAYTTQGKSVFRQVAELKSKNINLDKKIDSLYINKDYQDVLYFIFSINGMPPKEELRELLAILSNRMSGNYYRGQVNSIWQIAPGIYRNSNFQNNEKSMYYDVLSLQPESFTSDKSTYERWITMQHFGMPTRLLDITRNPLVAIYFACYDESDEYNNHDGAVFTFSPNMDEMIHFEDEKINKFANIYSLEENKSDDFLSTNAYIKGIAKNNRIKNQSGDFIFIGKSDSAIEDLQKEIKKTIIIDADAKETLLEQLENLNIHAATVYPDLTNMSKYLRSKNSKSKDSKLGKPINIRPNNADINLQKNNIDNTSKSIQEQPQFKLINDKFSQEQIGNIRSFAQTNNLKLDEFTDYLRSYIENMNKPSESVINLFKGSKPTLKERSSKRNELDNMITYLIKELIEV